MYDLQEPFRWLVDLSVIQAFDSGTLKLHDFFTGIDYRYRFEAEAKQRFIDLIHERFNAGVSYQGRVLKWDTVIEQKTTELCRFLVGKKTATNFTEPSPTFDRFDNREMRERINSLTSNEAKKLGIPKSTEVHSDRVRPSKHYRL